MDGPLTIFQTTYSFVLLPWKKQEFSSTATTKKKLENPEQFPLT